MKKVKSIRVVKDEKTKTKWSKEKSMGNTIRTETIWDFYLFSKSNPMVDKNHQWKMFLKDSDEQMGQQIKWKNGLGWLTVWLWNIWENKRRGRMVKGNRKIRKT